jgi:hypothetical protein
MMEKIPEKTKWTYWYFAVLLSLIVLIAFFYIITKYYA